MFKFHRSLLGTLGSCAILLASGLSWSSPAAAQAETPKRGGTAIFVLSQDPTSVNPATSSNTADRQVGSMIYQGLIQVSLDYQIKPLLAKSWTISPDGLTYTLNLNKAQWHDGKPFTSADVKYSLIEVNTKFSSVFAAAGRAIDSIETPAPDQVVIKLKRSFGPFILSLGTIQGGAIMPAHIFQGTDPLKNPATLATPVGTGPFKLSEWKRSDNIRLVKNKDYFEPDRPYLDEVVGKIIPQASARIQALKAGEVDLVSLFPPNDQAQVKAAANLKVEKSDVAPGMTFIFLNNSKKPFDDRKVRQALFMAIDRDYLMKNAFFDVGSVGVNPFTTDITWLANKDIDYRKLYPYDTAKANALLDEAGVKRGADGKRFAAKINIFSNSYPEFQQVALALKSMWGAVGVDVTVEAMEDATLMKKAYVDRDFDVTMNSYTSYSDPALGIARAFVTSGIGKTFANPSGYSNPEVDKLFEDGESGTTYEQRGPAYRKVQEIIAQDVPSLTIRQYLNIDAATKRLRGLWGNVQGNGDWTNAWLAQ